MDYFEARGLSAQDYANARLPAWLNHELRDIPRTGRILDFGCGLGQNLRALTEQRFVEVTGADVDPGAIAESRGTGCRVVDVGGGIERAFGPGECFDVIVALHVLEHVPKAEVIATLRKLRDLLAADGKLLIAVPNGHAFTGCYWAYEDFTHHTLFTSGSLKYVLNAAGFGNVAFVDTRGDQFNRPMAKLVKRLLFALFATQYRLFKWALNSPTHAPSPEIFTYELKARASR